MTFKRRYCTEKEKAAIVERQEGLCDICGEPLGLGEPTQFDHVVPRGLGNEGKPTAAVHRSCHSVKSRDDVARIAKAKRQSRLRAIRKLDREVRKRIRRRKIKSAGFSKFWRKRMDGTVERRTTCPA